MLRGGFLVKDFGLDFIVDIEVKQSIVRYYGFLFVRSFMLDISRWGNEGLSFGDNFNSQKIEVQNIGLYLISRVYVSKME